MRTTTTRDCRCSLLRTMSRSLSRSVLLVLIIATLASSQEYANQNDYGDYSNDYGNNGGDGGGGGGDSYQDYSDPYSQPDNLYADYAATKMEGAAAGAAGGFGLGKMLLCSSVSWFLGGKFHAGRTAKKLKAKHLKEQKQLYTQYYNDVYKLSEQNQELLGYVDQLQETLKSTEAKHEMEAIQRDYDEFKQPDLDGDDRISRAEFNLYVKNYLSNYPGLSEADYPKFEDFDHDGDGSVSFKEYAQQMALQAQQAELEELYGTQSKTGGGAKAKKQHQGLQDLYKDTAKQASAKYR